MAGLHGVQALCVAASLVAAGVAARADGDIGSHDEALAKAGMCVYPAGYVDTLAQGSMAPPRGDGASEPSAGAAASAAPADTATLIARLVATRRVAGDMTALPVPLSALIAARPAGG